MKNLIYTQQYIISIFQARNSLIAKSTLNEDLLDYPYSLYFKYMKESFIKFQAINLDYLMSKLNQNDFNFLLEFTDPYVIDNLTTLKRYENMLHERDIKRKLESNILAYQNENISLLELKERLSTPSVLTDDILTFGELETTLTSEQRAIDFAGWKKLRALLNLRETDFAIIAAYTGKGKTSFALNLLEDLSRNYEVTYINLEMGIASLHKRMIAINSEIDLSELDRFKYLLGDRQKEILKKIEFIKGRKITLVNQSQSITSIKEIVASKNNKHSIFIIDHIGLLKAPGNSLYEKMTTIAKELRKISLDYNTTIIGLSQLSRQGAKGKPDLSMLRDSGEIEQSATKVILLYSIENPQDKTEKYFVEIAKNRDGMTGKVAINYNKSTQKMREIL
ncbi:MAG: hypothetical protein GX675_04895 [Erysipelotrichaceae bacterium]|nr:hypothetical protein [Erysipelotrichaceae bacterium]